MDTQDKNIGGKIDPKRNVHHVLAHSYVVYFILFLIGVSLDLVFGYKIFPNSIMVPAGVGILLLATIIILWAQKTGNDLKKVEEKKVEHFCRGPYCYTRIPTQWGLFLLLLGFGITINAFFVILSTILSFVIFKFVFMGKHDRVLIEKYGEAYAEYKKLVKF